MTYASSTSRLELTGQAEMYRRIPPLPRTPFIGRNDEVGSIASILTGESGSFVTLVGAGGVGKTRLAIQVAHEVASQFADGVLFVSLAPIRDPSLVIVTIARAFGLSDTPNVLMSEQLIDFLRTRHLLLVLDNLEQVVDAAADIATIHAACPRLKILATSRVPLRISAEQRVAIHPLPFPRPTESLDLVEIGRYAGVQLFVARAEAIKSDFSLTAHTAASVVSICSRLDGLPLAIELAASRLRLLDVSALSKRLEHSLPLLTGGARDQPDRLRTMRTAIEWSYDLLTPEEQLLFRRLSVFVGGFDLAAVEAMASTSEDASSALDGVSSLIEKSLLRQTAGPRSNDPRFQMFETVREFGIEQLIARGEELSVRTAHATYLLTLVQRAFESIDGPDYERELERLDAEQDNVRAALAWAQSTQTTSIGLPMAQAMARYWVVRGFYQEGRIWLRRILACPPFAPSSQRIEALRAAGWLARLQGDPDDAAALQTEALKGAQSLNDELNAAASLQELSLAEMHRGNFDRGLAHIENALELLRRSEHTTPHGPQLVSVVLANVGQVSLASGDVARAIGAATEAVERQRSLGYTWALGDTLRILGDALYENGEYIQALTAYRESVEITRQEGDRRFLSNALAGIANVAAAMRWPARAASLFAASGRLREKIGAGIEIWQRERYERALALTKSSLSLEKFDAAWSDGAAMAIDAVVAEALADFEDEAVTARAVMTDGGASANLTPREFDVLRLVSEGLTDREIAELLSISPRTVGFHVTNLLGKLGVESRTAVAIYAVRHGLI